MNTITNQTARKFKLLRNIVILATIAIGFGLWLAMPATISNNALFHIGSGESGSKLGALVILLLPFISLTPDKNAPEIHTEDPKEKAKMLEERDLKDSKRQFVLSLIFLVLVSFIMTLGLILQ